MLWNVLTISIKTYIYLKNIFIFSSSIGKSDGYINEVRLMNKWMKFAIINGF